VKPIQGDHMKTNYSNPRTHCAGFSMIEVLVASSILVVIVMMLAMLFQQTSLAWRTGVMRANCYMQVRSAFGAIERDAAAAVDAREIPEDLRSALGNGQQVFRGTELRFYTLKGAGFENSKPGNTALRALSYITYSQNGKRTESVLKGDGSEWKKDDSQTIDFFVSSSKNKADLNLDFDFAQSATAQSGTSAGNNEFPLFFSMKGRVSFSGGSRDIGAASAGPDKVWNTKDDIRTWVEK